MSGDDGLSRGGGAIAYAFNAKKKKKRTFCLSATRAYLFTALVQLEMGGGMKRVWGKRSQTRKADSPPFLIGTCVGGCGKRLLLGPILQTEAWQDVEEAEVQYL